MAERQGQRIAFARDLVNTPRRQELDGVASKLSAETELAHRSSAECEHVSGVYLRRVTLSSGRFARIVMGRASSSCHGGRRSSTSLAIRWSVSCRPAQSIGISAASADYTSRRKD
jgi:hypothetical protein